MKSGAWSPSEPLVNISETGEVPDAGDVEELDTTEVTPESSLGDALEGASPTVPQSSFCVVLMSCRVNFHVVRSALQYSACRI